MVLSRIHSPYRCTPQWLRKTGTEKIWVRVVERRLKVLAPNPAISLRLRLRVLMRGPAVRISCYLALETDACAACIKESRMKCADPTKPKQEYR
jgi:hypothetical protein